MSANRELQRTLDNVRESIAVACRNFSPSTIDRYFIQSGCDESWWTADGYYQTDSERFNRAFGWIEGIRRNKPHQEIPIIVNVCAKMLTAPGIDYQIRKQLEIIVDQLGADRLRSPSLDTLQLDSRVLTASGKLFADGHYKEAAREAFVALIAAVREKSGKTGGMDKDVMIQAFKEDGGLLRISDNPNEQQGYMWLFAGSVSAIRNPLSHVSGAAIDKHEAMEYLALASLLFRYLDRSHIS
jgi:uncharacterized protein (TIGR02391 family)